MEALHYTQRNDTICALATAGGSAAIAVIRISGPQTFPVLEEIFCPATKNKKISEVNGQTLHFGRICKDKEVIDEVMLSVFRQPHSYTGEDVAEISCHGSVYIQQRIIELLLAKGIRLAEPGEYTMRAFMNDKMDLAQAEAVGDLIASQSQSQHQLAMQQMRGGYSQTMKNLRTQLLDFTSLIELELDFSEEDVEFADRNKFLQLIEEIKTETHKLIASFKTGNVLKKGIPVAIIGKPNSGKSTLLNALLNEERAIVSEIPGTTRDVIEDSIIIDGISFRFIDTAGLRETSETVESMGVERTYNKIEQASIVLYLFDASRTPLEEIKAELDEFKAHTDVSQKRFVILGNKTDMLERSPKHFSELVDMETIFISAKRRENLKLITDSLLKSVDQDQLENDTVVSSARHHEALLKAYQAMESVESGMKQGIPSDLLSIDLRSALHHIGSITGDISTDEILGNIFSRFCIGK
ncbi:MAG: tRNA uridine-5-carboxymethylaminomethyl(34) synthesis GTPase MnmE [Bacteroidota bacterium]